MEFLQLIHVSKRRNYLLAVVIKIQVESDRIATSTRIRLLAVLQPPLLKECHTECNRERQIAQQSVRTNAVAY